MQVTEYFIGHLALTYLRKRGSEKAEIFQKIEPYLTFLNVHQLQRQGADIQTKVEELEDLNQSLRQRDKVKDDAIEQLSDQLVALTGKVARPGKKPRSKQSKLVNTYNSIFGNSSWFIGYLLSRLLQVLPKCCVYSIWEVFHN
jgi:hypothetical protein